MSQTQLRWSGNLEAQQQADQAWNRLLSKQTVRYPHPVASKRKKKKRRNCRKRKRTHKNRKVVNDYHVYLGSKWWKARRERAIADTGGCCEVCGLLIGLQVHHLNYKHLYGESKADLQVLCRGCHENVHEGKVFGVMDPMTREYLSLDL